MTAGRPRTLNQLIAARLAAFQAERDAEELRRLAVTPDEIALAEEAARFVEEERRALAALPTSLPRCGAKTRSGAPCAAYPVAGRTRCRMHGGRSLGGEAHPAFRHGERSAVLRREARARADAARRELAAALVQLRLFPSSPSTVGAFRQAAAAVRDTLAELQVPTRRARSRGWHRLEPSARPADGAAGIPAPGTVDDTTTSDRTPAPRVRDGARTGANRPSEPVTDADQLEAMKHRLIEALCGMRIAPRPRVAAFVEAHVLFEIRGRGFVTMSHEYEVCSSGGGEPLFAEYLAGVMVTPRPRTPAPTSTGDAP